MRTFPGLLVFLVLLSTTPATARAQSAQDKAAAEALFREARELRKQKKVVGACEKLEASQRLDPAAGTLLNLGDCYEALGRTASAWATFTEAISWARRTYDERKENEARRRAKALEPRLIRVVIEVPKESRLPDLKVTRDGAVVDAAIFGAAVPVDPGKHEIRAEASGREPFVASGGLEEGKTWRVTVPLLEVKAAKKPAVVTPAPPVEPPPRPAPKPVNPAPVPSPTSAPAGAVPETPAPAPPAPEDDAEKRRKGWRTLGIVIGCAGLAGIVVGLSLGAKARGTWRDAQAHCDGGSCFDEEGVMLANDAGHTADLATYVTVGGVAVAAFGVIVWSASHGPDKATQPSSSASAASIRAVPGGGILSFEGTFR